MSYAGDADDEATPAAFGPVTMVRDVPSAGVTRLIIELPLESHVEATTLFYGQLVLVTLAPEGVAGKFGVIRAATSDFEGAPTSTPSGAIEKPAGGPLARSAAMICSAPLFIRFAQEEFHSSDPAKCVREHCGVQSRAELDHDGRAARCFHDLMTKYRVWQESGK